jgi:hypothetical protein
MGERREGIAIVRLTCAQEVKWLETLKDLKIMSSGSRYVCCVEE